MTGRRRDERGAGTILIVAACAALITVAVGVVAIVSWGLTVERAQSVADLAALGAAQEVVDGGDGCAVAGRTAMESGGQLLDCQVRGSRPIVVVEVTVRLPLPQWLVELPYQVERTATAGTL